MDTTSPYAFLKYLLTDDIYVVAKDIVTDNNILKETETRGNKDIGEVNVGLGNIAIAKNGNPLHNDDLVDQGREICILPKSLAIEVEKKSVEKTKGSKGKNIVFFVQYSENCVITEADNKILEKIMSSIKTNWEDVLLINTQLVDTEELRKLLKGSKMIVSFGVTNLFTQFFTDQKYNLAEKSTVRFLLADNIIEIEGDVSKKHKLWACLKQAFFI